MNYFTTRRGLMMATLGTPLMTGCLWPRFFDLGWDEEVQLHDGRVIVVKVKYTYERLGGPVRFSRYGSLILRDTTLTFDAGPPNGMISQFFMGVHPILLDQADGIWYVVLNGGPYGQSRQVPGQNWGPGQNFSEQNIALLKDKNFSPTSIKQLPAMFTIPNLLVQYSPVEELAAFNSTRLTLTQKASYLNKYPLGPGDMKIERPQLGASAP